MRIDHLAVAGDSLEEASEFLEEALGVSMEDGGKHNLWYFLGKVRDKPNTKFIRQHSMNKLPDGNFMLFLRQVVISDDDRIILQKFDKERMENNPGSANFDVEKFTHMTFKLTQMYNSTYEKYVEISIDNQKALKPLVCRHD